MKGVVRIRREVMQKMSEEARRAPAEECCGLLAGRDGVVTMAFPATNKLHSATEFEIAPQELFRLFRAMRAAGVEHMGIFHSHPTGQNAPSPRDVERAYYPEAVYFIISPQTTTARAVRAFSIRDTELTELRVEETE